MTLQQLMLAGAAGSLLGPVLVLATGLAVWSLRQPWIVATAARVTRRTAFAAFVAWMLLGGVG